MKPYEEVRTDNVIYREFDENIDNHELVWHRDKRDRKVKVINGKGWKFQFDNEIPFELTNGIEFFVEKERFHRVIKGNDTLEIEIIEY